jgi:hypothetical protein
MTSFFEQNERRRREQSSKRHDELISRITRLHELMEEIERNPKLKNDTDIRSKFGAEIVSLKLMLLSRNTAFTLTTHRGEAEKTFHFAELQYACLNWARHLQQSGKKLVDDGQAYTFARKYYDDWEGALTSGLVGFRPWTVNLEHLLNCVSVSLPSSS